MHALKLREFQNLYDFNIIYWTRTAVLLILAYFIKKANSTYVNYEKKNNELLNKVVSNCVESTPLWFKKYKDNENDRSFYAPTKKRIHIVKPNAL